MSNSGKKPRSRGFYTVETYEKLIEAFAVHGGHAKRVVESTGFTRAAVDRVWNYGWKGLPWARPIHQVLGLGSTNPFGYEDRIKGLDRAALLRAFRQTFSEYSAEVLAQEPDSAAALLNEAHVEAAHLMARAEAVLADAESKKSELEALQAKTEQKILERLTRTDVAVQERMAEVEARGAELLKERLAAADAEAKAKFASLMDKARVDAAEVMADEAAATKFGRKAAVGAAAMAAIVLQEAQAMAQQVREAMKTLKELSPKEAIRIVRDLVVLAKEAQKVVIYALQAERIRVGKPTEVLGVEFTEQTLAEQEVQIEAMRIALEERKEMEARAKRLAQEVMNEKSGSEMASGRATLN